MSYYIAIIEEGGPDHATGIWFPDLPGCFSAGDSLDEAMENAPEALRMHLDALRIDGQAVPLPRGLSAIKADPAWEADFSEYIVALVAPQPLSFRPAAE